MSEWQVAADRHPAARVERICAAPTKSDCVLNEEAILSLVECLLPLYAHFASRQEEQDVARLNARESR